MTPPSSKPHQFHDLRRLQQHPHPSPLSIRNLVKHFSTSMKEGTVSEAPKRHTQRQPAPYKRQARRRLHTTRPYQDRLLNMAEARKEIVTALKFHRASLHHHQQEAKHQPLQRPCSEQGGGILSPTNPITYLSFPNNISNLGHDFSFSSPLSLPNPSNPLAPPQTPPNYLPFNFNHLPNRTLGLNLNFQDFDDLEAALHSQSSSPSVAISQGEGTSAPSDAVDSIGAPQVVLSPKFVKNMEHHQVTDDDAAYTVFDGPMEFPDWLNSSERCFEQCSQEFVLDPTLPW